MDSRRRCGDPSRVAVRLLLSAVAASTLCSAQIFDYDRAAPLNYSEKQADVWRGVHVDSCNFESQGGKATGFVVRPDAAGRHPAIIWMHSGGPLNWLGDAVLMAQAGAVSLIIDPPSQGNETPQAARESMIDSVIAIRRAVDVLQSREDVDPKRIAYVGHSYGAMMGADAVATDARFKAAVFEVGLLGMDVHIGTSPHPWAAGMRKQLGDKLPAYLAAIEPLNASHFLPGAHAVSLLFQSAHYDPGVPEKDALDFFNVAKEPKQLKWYPTARDVSDMSAVADRARFLAARLGLSDIDALLQSKIAGGAAAATRPTVVVISLDGFPAFALDNPRLPVPTLRRLIKEGAWARRMTPINPTVTWPNHTTLVTGVDARQHGVLFNGLLDLAVKPPKIEPWIDKDKLVHARTVYDAAHDAGLTTAQVDWVAIYNAPTITWQFPEKPDPDGPIEREMENAGIVTRDDVAEFLGKSNPAWRDEIWTAAAAHIIRQHKPNLLLFHLLNLDSTHHAYGPMTTASYAGMAYADSRVREILDAIEAAGLKDRTTVIVVSDHGFRAVQHNIRPNAVVKDAEIVPEGGSAMVYSKADLRERLAGIEGIERVVEPKDYASLGLPTPEQNPQAPNLLLLAKPGYAFTRGSEPPVVVDAPPGTGQHGYINSDPDMDAIFIAWGRGIKAGARTERISNLDVAPTIAALLGVDLPGADGHALTDFLSVGR